ncbi:metalloregulator ArsR/SmtB family transcription factor [Rubinisphaera sp.]|uniref:ArsR/SmtB family transcription factor n=1 Tax=Rubinisphaera sp. TaxID=2024857 RepID=UPI000C0E2458|nr:metalloregulator ArsR/SmtB family transcription factor [Rubinisphaera sp.]MBV08959.1 transcriptional regulator [Rubinisphaera sp.]HCS53354.1 transcriptional regulator [Planctomycetaceae bacterium]|tara:strand:+ start:187 stop:504 length:318 start_codon:yes stop_codon:yes gene_type:complete
MNNNLQKYEARAKIAKAMSHPSRLLMLDLLQKQELSVGQLTQEVGADQSTVSKHLAILKEVGLVSVRKEGAMSFYQLKCNCLDGFFSCMESVLVSDLTCRQNALK